MLDACADPENSVSSAPNNVFVVINIFRRGSYGHLIREEIEPQGFQFASRRGGGFRTRISKETYSH